ncbi:hypothetical protein F5144DRAFT_376851 [Chaetomium tenue]|uniref:Uncharacterized protein n=1 Tax=Chaetomium tenue TaxID=1854479 RepID=A0ACB7P030_9PEZI|nr:hypothetical protein F5144DRAFT_376851 [Chaetomium globosum]
MWKENLGSLVDYLDSRILLSFALSVNSRVEPPAQDHLGALHELMDHMIYPSARALDDAQIRDHLAGEWVYYPGAMDQCFSSSCNRGVLLGHAVFHACMEGAVTAAENLVALFCVRSAFRPSYTPSDEVVTLQGARRAAIQVEVLKQAPCLTQDNRHHAVLSTGPRRRSIKDPFVKLEIEALTTPEGEIREAVQAISDLMIPKWPRI